MRVSREEVEKIARLAELQVDEAALPALAAELSSILEYVAQIAGVAGSESAQPFVPGPAAIRFRPDEVRPAPLAFGPERMAPQFRDGFFLVPRLGAFDVGRDAGDEDDA
jgi:aspartyl-tRNA(Asn)/glutamyl-tRNA(Gln) amidotransferase subunit C